MSAGNDGVEVEAYPVTLCRLPADLARDFFWDLVQHRLLDLGYLRFSMFFADKAIGSHARPRGTSCVLHHGGAQVQEAFVPTHKPSVGTRLLLLAYRPG